MTENKLRPVWDGAIDLDALLVALVLVPHSYPRNKFYQLYRSPGAQRVRRRAATVRGIVAELIHEASDVSVEQEGESVVLRYRLAEVGVLRKSRLDPSEHALVYHCVERARGEQCPILQRLGRPLAADKVVGRVKALLAGG